MKSITEILGGAQILLDISYDIQDCFEEYLSEDHRTFIHMLRVMESHFPRMEKSAGGRGRPRKGEVRQKEPQGYKINPPPKKTGKALCLIQRMDSCRFP